jgi:hypothetical protein
VEAALSSAIVAMQQQVRRSAAAFSAVSRLEPRPGSINYRAFAARRAIAAAVRWRKAAISGPARGAASAAVCTLGGPALARAAALAAAAVAYDNVCPPGIQAAALGNALAFDAHPPAQPTPTQKNKHQ